MAPSDSAKAMKMGRSKFMRASYPPRRARSNVGSRLTTTPTTRALDAQAELDDLTGDAGGLEGEAGGLEGGHGLFPKK